MEILKNNLKDIAKRNNWNSEKLISEIALMLAYTNQEQLEQFVHNNKKYWKDK